MNWKKHGHAALRFAILAILLLQASYIISASNRLVLQFSDHVVAIRRTDQPAIFAIGSLTAMILALASASAAAVVWFRRSDLGERSPTLRHSRGWTIVNLLAICMSVWTGYRLMTPERLAGVNPDKLFCLAILITAPLFVVGTLWLAAKRCGYFARPSLSRFPLNFRSDPLQFLFIGACTLLGAAIGSSIRLPNTGTVGYWTVVSQWSMFLGWVIGQVIGYAIYRDRINPRVGRGRSQT